MKYFYKLDLFSISKSSLACLIISINLREPFFHSRELFLMLFFITSFRFLDYKNIIYSLILLVIWGITSSLNIFVPGSNAIDGVWYNTVIVSIYLLLLTANNKKYYKTVIDSYLMIGFIVSLITIILWFICLLNETIRVTLQVYFKMLDETKNLFICAIDTRKIIFFRMNSVYYRTAPCMIPGLSYCLVMKLLNKSGRRENFLILLFSVALVFSGARANMMAVLLLLFTYICFKLILKKRYASAFLLILSTLAMGFFLMMAFLGDGTGSTNVKKGHQMSYNMTFNSDIFRTLFYGWGVGSSFYSLGRNKMVDITELSHLETIRRYGFISTMVIFLGIWLKPALTLMVEKRSILKYFLFISELSYVFVACTNPFLLDSVGFSALLFFSVYFDFLFEEKKC